MQGELTRDSTARDAVLLDALRRGWRRAQGIFREMFPGPVSLVELSVGARDRSKPVDRPPESIVVGMRFRGSVTGLAALVLERTAAGVLVESLLGEAQPDDAEVLSLLTETSLELGNVVLNAIVAEVGQALDETYRFDVPTLLAGDALEAADGVRTFLLRGEIVIDASHSAPAQVIVHRGPGIPGGR